MPRRPQPIPTADLDREIAVTFNMSARLYNKLLEQAQHRGRVFIGAEVAQLVNEADAIVGLLGHSATLKVRALGATFAKAVIVAEETGDSVTYRKAVVDVLKALWERWPNRSNDDRRKLFADVIAITDIEADEIPSNVALEVGRAGVQS